jgi:hypothetical protein
MQKSKSTDYKRLNLFKSNTHVSKKLGRTRRTPMMMANEKILNAKSLFAARLSASASLASGIRGPPGPPGRPSRIMSKDQE